MNVTMRRIGRWIRTRRVARLQECFGVGDQVTHIPHPSCMALQVYRRRAVSVSSHTEVDKQQEQTNRGRDNSHYQQHHQHKQQQRGVYEIRGGSKVPVVSSATEIGTLDKFSKPITLEEQIVAKGFRQHWTEIRDPNMHALNNAIVELETIDQVVHHYHEYGDQYRIPNVVCAAHQICWLDPSGKRSVHAIEPLLGYLDRYCHSYWGFFHAKDIAALLYPFAHYSRLPRPKVSLAASEQLQQKLQDQTLEDGINTVQREWGIPETNEQQAFESMKGVLLIEEMGQSADNSLWNESKQAHAIANQAWALARCSVFSSSAFESIIKQATNDNLLILMHKEALLRIGWAIAYGLCDSGSQRPNGVAAFARVLADVAETKLTQFSYEEAVLLSWCLIAMRHWALRIYDLVLTATPLKENPQSLPLGTKRQLVSTIRMIDDCIPQNVYRRPDLPEEIIQEVDEDTYESIEFDSQDPMEKINAFVQRRIREAGFEAHRNILVTSTIDGDHGQSYKSSQDILVPLGLPDVNIAFQIRHAPGTEADGQDDANTSALNTVSVDGTVSHLNDDAASELAARGWTIAVIDYREWTRLDRIGQQQYIRELAHGYTHQLTRYPAHADRVYFWRRQGVKQRVVENERRTKQHDGSHARRCSHHRRQSKRLETVDASIPPELIFRASSN